MELISQASPQTLILIGIFLIIFATLNLVVLIFLRLKKKKPTHLEKLSFSPQSFSLPSPFLTLSVSEKFQKDLENLILNQTLHNLSVAKEKMIKDLERVSRLYQDEVERIIGDLKAKKATIENEIEALVDGLNKDFANSKKILSENALQKTEQEIKNLFLNLKEELKNSISKYEEELKKEITGVKKELEGYREKKKKEIDEKFYEVLNQVTKSILGRTIDISTHEDLVLKVLEKAKKEGFFD